MTIQASKAHDGCFEVAYLLDTFLIVLTLIAKPVANLQFRFQDYNLCFNFQTYFVTISNFHFYQAFHCKNASIKSRYAKCARCNFHFFELA